MKKIKYLHILYAYTKSMPGVFTLNIFWNQSELYFDGKRANFKPDDAEFADQNWVSKRVLIHKLELCHSVLIA